MKRITLFAKGNVDVHDSLHSSRVDGQVLWNGINGPVRAQFPDCLVRLRHETFTRSDAVLKAEGQVPEAIAERQLPLGTYPMNSQFSTALFDTPADAYVLSILGDIGTGLFSHREDDYLFYPSEMTRWASPDRDWLKANFARLDMLDADTSMANFTAIIERLQAKYDAPILIYNVSSVVPEETTHCLMGLGETFTTRVRRFNLGLAELSEQTGVSIIDVDSLIARAGADRLKVDALHLTPEGHQLVTEEVVRVLADLGVLS